MGELTLAAGYLEMAIIAMVCRIVGRSEEELRISSNYMWCRKLNEVAPSEWSDAQKKDLAQRLAHIRGLYRRRNELIHTALATAGDNSIPGVPSGAIIDLRSYGVGFTKREGDTWTIGLMAKRIHLQELDALTEEIHQARVGLVPYMELIDKIRHPPRPLPKPELGKRL
jgi:hypothetical protein